mmetsp:Transcript_35624/g.75966  ORF Transcript_35624/g.75966 Transcript_35624/m.75966 type:complete len:90 (+) Transcript_35624:56-325(+)
MNTEGAILRRCKIAEFSLKLSEMFRPEKIRGATGCYHRCRHRYIGVPKHPSTEVPTHSLEPQLWKLKAPGAGSITKNNARPLQCGNSFR